MKQAIYNISAIQGDTWPGATFTVTVNGAAPVNNPFVIAVGLHYKRDGLGSRTMYIK